MNSLENIFQVELSEPCAGMFELLEEAKPNTARRRV